MTVVTVYAISLLTRKGIYGWGAVMALSLIHIYMPENTTVPVPATLELCGHGLNGKGPSSHAAMLMASNGIAVLLSLIHI